MRSPNNTSPRCHKRLLPGVGWLDQGKSGHASGSGQEDAKPVSPSLTPALPFKEQDKGVCADELHLMGTVQKSRGRGQSTQCWVPNGNFHKLHGGEIVSSVALGQHAEFCRRLCGCGIGAQGPGYRPWWMEEPEPFVVTQRLNTV